MGLAAMAVLLSVVCTYTLTAQTVASAQHELAIRRALGATAARVGRLVAVRATVIAAAGALVGTGLAFAGARLLSSLLHAGDAGALTRGRVGRTSRFCFPLAPHSTHARRSSRSRARAVRHASADTRTMASLLVGRRSIPG